MRRIAACLVLALLVALAPRPTTTAAHEAVLRVCADGNNLPYSNRAGEGFEDALARLVAGELHMKLQHHHWPQRRGFVRNTLKAGKCDVIMGVPAELDMVDTTIPYYRSSYVFVARATLEPAVRSLNDRRLRTLKVGVPVVGDDYANPPPVHALSRRGIVDNVVGFSVFGDYAQDSPPLELVRAVQDGRVDVALAWGPIAGFVAKHSKEPLRLTPVSPVREGPYSFVFSMAMGVKHGDAELKARLNQVLTSQRRRIEEVLREHGVPLM